MRAVADPALNRAGCNGPFADGPEINGHMHSMVGNRPLTMSGNFSVLCNPGLGHALPTATTPRRPSLVSFRAAAC